MKRVIRTYLKPWPVLGICGALLIAGTVMAVDKKTDSKPKDTGQAINVPVDQTPVQRGAVPSTSYAPIVKKVAPAVVKIVVSSQPAMAQNEQVPGFGFEDPFWRHFFGGPNGPSAPGRRQMPMQHGLGSGVIVTKEGYILTNNHVVDGSKEVKVTLQDGREFDAKVVGRDDKSDLAVIKIQAENLPSIPFADSQNVQVGDEVLAIGNPFGVGQTVTHGIVSATGRGGMGIEAYEDFIQTDAPINPGNSGGALVDVEGRLIGINTAILSRSGGNQGIGFAIPSDLARTVMTSLVQYGHVTRGYAGVMIQNVTPELAKEFRLNKAAGALVSEVVPDGPADKAGLKDGDVVVKFNGKDIADGHQLQLAVAEIKPGTTVPMEIMRNGSSRTVKIAVGRQPGSEQLAKSGSDNGNTNDTGALQGVAVSDLSNEARQEFRIPENVQGAVVTQVEPDSAAAQAGLNPGDVIESINRHDVKNADQAVQLAENANSKHTLLRIWSQGGSHYVVLDESQTG